jgi:hypothetical protein
VDVAEVVDLLAKEKTILYFSHTHTKIHSGFHFLFLFFRFLIVDDEFVCIDVRFVDVER